MVPACGGLAFLDECSRYVVPGSGWWRWMDGDSVSVKAQAAVEKRDHQVRPMIQTDNGSGFISGEFKLLLTQNAIGYRLIHPHCPKENGLVEPALAGSGRWVGRLTNTG